MTALTLRYIKGHFVVSGPDIEPTRFKTRREAKDWCVAHYPGSPIKEITDLRSDFMSAAPAWWRPRGARTRKIKATTSQRAHSAQSYFLRAEYISLRRWWNESVVLEELCRWDGGGR